MKIEKPFIFKCRWCLVGGNDLARLLNHEYYCKMEFEAHFVKSILAKLESLSEG